MGGASSKASRAAAKSAADTTRRYPTQKTPRPINPISPAKTNGPTPTLRASSPGPTVHPEAHAAEKRDATINLDASDPDLALNARMRQLGPVQPNPTMSHSSIFNQKNHQILRPGPKSSGPQSQKLPQTSQFSASPSAPMQTLFPSPITNPAVTLLNAREKITEEANEEFEKLGRVGKALRGRKYLDVSMVREALVMRDIKGMDDREIEDVMGLESGVLKGLGRKGIVAAAEL